MNYAKLQLQRASAGSGKTYTLAKKFLCYFLTIRDDEMSPRRLRRPVELRDSLAHILAVTFTNKATAEMQDRIIEKLSAMANHKPGDKTDYIMEFAGDLGVAPADVSLTSAYGLKVLLNNYSDFRVSTIDSFFQLVLRTFAYESELNDAYQVEIDGDYLSRQDVDAVYEDIEQLGSRSEASFWLSQLMMRSHEKKGAWNMFGTSASSKKKDNEANYFLRVIRRLESEKYKEIRDELTRYFESGVDFRQLYLDLKDKYEEPVRSAWREAVSAARRFLSYYDRVDVKKGDGRSDTGKLEVHAKTLVSSNWDNVFDGVKIVCLPAEKFVGKGKLAKDLAANEPEAGQTAELYAAMRSAIENWKEAAGVPEVLHWHIYEHNFPYLGLLKLIREKREQLLRENNAVELAETNVILTNIISGADAPFIYERIGSRLNHFLIDEFQDTSKLQWENMYPLLSETMSKGNENLIIGDAKQSIYRFRNADPSLITTRVPAMYPDCEQLGDSVADNTNWRSDRNIVRFNNTLFRYMSGALSDLSAEKGQGMNFNNLYSNVVQTPNKKENAGYIEVRLNREGNNDDMCTAVIEIIKDALDRGFEQKDIAVLTRTNRQNDSVIAAFTAHNQSGADLKIEFISEQSLHIDASPAVQVIVAVLETIARGAAPEIRDGEEGARKGTADLREVACNLRFFFLQHPEETVQNLVDNFLNGEGGEDAVEKMLDSMEAVTLPALVEAVTAHFITPEMRRLDAAYIAAFQDKVLEYCEVYPTDISSFLNWWSRVRNNASIAAPEDSNAVKVLTIHKSKGLEYPIVIVPFVNNDYEVPDESDDTRREWNWVRPVALGDVRLPGYVPISMHSQLSRTVHDEVYKRYADEVRMDMINTEYVAYTRAVNELYILADARKDNGYSSSGLMYGALDDGLAQPEANDERMLTIADISVEEITEKKPKSKNNPELIDKNIMTLVTVGNKYAHKPADKKKEEGSAIPHTDIILDDYCAYKKMGALKFKEDNLPQIIVGEVSVDAEDTDPRSEGNMLHTIMQRVLQARDLPKAVKRLTVGGYISEEQARLYESMLAEAISDPAVKRWFDGTMRVMTERSLISSGSKLRRPDRIMVDEEDNAIVVDYKFGEHRDDNHYQHQVREYVDKLKNTGLFRTVKGYLWYVRKGEIDLIRT